MSEELLKENIICEDGLPKETELYLPIHTENKGICWKIYVCNCIATLGLVSVGMAQTWTSPVLPQLMSNNTEINPLGTSISTIQITAIASIPHVSAFCMLLIIAKLSDKLGRKKMMLIGSISISLSMSVIAFTSNIYVYYLCLVVNGLSFIILYVNVEVYNTEISEVENRGKLVGLTGLGGPTGILINYIFGPLTSVKIISLVCATPAALHVLFNFYLVESPSYLALKGHEEKALKALKEIRNIKDSRQLQYEYTKIKLSAIENSKKSKTRLLKLFKLKASKKATFIAMLLSFSQQMSSIHVMLGFMATIFNEADAYLSGNMVAILVGIIQILSFITAAYFVDKLGRRILLLTSTFSVIICLFALGIFFYLKHIQVAIPTTIKWLPILFVLIFMIGYSLGLGAIPMTMVGEIFPTELRSLGVSTILLMDVFLIIITMFLFPLLKSMYGMHFCFFLYCLMELIGFIAMFFLVPETKQKTFFEIQQLLSR